MEDEAGETTLYYDAEDGTLRDEDGDEVTFETGTESSAEPESLVDEDGEEEGEQEGEEGSQTPHAAQSGEAAEQQRPTQTITGTSPGVGPSPIARRPSTLGRLSSATQQRVSSTRSYVQSS